MKDLIQSKPDGGGGGGADENGCKWNNTKAIQRTAEWLSVDDKDGFSGSTPPRTATPQFSAAITDIPRDK
jgi:hypothetical protein